MAPYTKEDEINYESMKKNAPQAAPREYVYVYRNFLTYTYWHLAALYGLYLGFTTAKWATVALAIILYMAAQIGVTAGAHRLWSHRSYKAKLPLQIILMMFHSLSFQNTVYDWVRDHRLHHKYSDTDADPHNSSRGFFFAHFGWVLVKKHPEVLEKGKRLNLTDVKNNPVLWFQKKYAVLVIGLIGFVLPTVVPIYFWGESLSCAWHLTICRFISNLNATFLVNSAAHKFGYRPYDKTILPSQNVPVSMFSLGEGFHNYHHVYPWDYRAAELGNTWFNMTTLFIDFFAWIGWAYDLKTVSKESIKQKAEKSGDGSGLWGWMKNHDTKMNETVDGLSKDVEFESQEKSLEASNNTEAHANNNVKQYNNTTVLARQLLSHKNTNITEAILANNIAEKYSNKTLIARQLDKQRSSIIASHESLRLTGDEVQLGDFKHHVFLFKPYKQKIYRAFCAGSIIAADKVLSSTNCFLTNRKRYKMPISSIKVVAGVLETLAEETSSSSQQWRDIQTLHSQRFYKYPAFNLAVLILKTEFSFNDHVNKIPYAIKNLDYDGVCVSTTVKSSSSWSEKKTLFSEQLQMVPRDLCEETLLRSCRLYYCTAYKTRYIFSEAEGAGLVCRETGDPEETDTKQGLLIGVTSLINVHLPTLHHRVPTFHKWVTDGGRVLLPENLVVMTALFLLAMLRCSFFMLYVIGRMEID